MNRPEKFDNDNTASTMLALGRAARAAAAQLALAPTDTKNAALRAAAAALRAHVPEILAANARDIAAAKASGRPDSFVVASVHRDAGSAAREPFGNGQSDALRGTGYQGGLTGQINVHNQPPMNAPVTQR